MFWLEVSTPPSTTQYPRSDSITSSAYTVLLTINYSDKCNTGVFVSVFVCVCVAGGVVEKKLHPVTALYNAGMIRDRYRK